MALREALTSFSFDGRFPVQSSLANNIVSQANSLGFSTFWFSNQNERGAWGNPVASLGHLAATSKFLWNKFTKNVRPAFDHEMVTDLHAALAAPVDRKFIVIHTYAGHFDYCSNVPSGLRDQLKIDDLGPAYFGDAVDLSVAVNCYDNSIRYVDSVVDQTISEIEGRSDPSVLIYIPDHGEDPDNGTGHNSSKHSISHVLIPHVWFFNKAAQKQYPEFYTNLKGNLEKPFNAADLFETLLHLLQGSEQRADQKRSLVSKLYTTRPRKIVPVQVNYVDFDDPRDDDLKDSLEKMRIHLAAVRKTYKKPVVLAHRVDSLGKLMEAQEVFDGVELDIVFDPSMDEFFVYHPPKKNMNLTLERYLKATSHSPNFRFWFDWKNPEPALFTAALRRMSDLAGKFQLRNRALLELGPGYIEFAAPVSVPGLALSYYLTPLVLSQRSSAEISMRLKRAGVAGLSFDASLSPIVQRAPEFLGFQRYTWNLNIKASVPFEKEASQFTGYEFLLVSQPSTFNY